MKKGNRFFALLTALALLLSCAACGGKNTASTMSLTKTEGDVEVTDDNDKDISVRDDLRLYSGYQVRTRRESYAWIDLDAVKLAKLDESSRVELQKEDRELELVLRSGSVFFNVTEPLEEDESMTIRTSTMAVGIRGTCGWVEIPQPGMMNVYLLEGTVTCTVPGETATVTAGEMARLDEAKELITVEPFGKTSIPGFVIPELAHIDLPLDDIPETASSSGGTSEPEGDDPFAAAAAAYREIVARPEDCDFYYEEAYMDPIVPSGVYDYALIWVSLGPDVPALLLRQESANSFNVVEVFQYYPEQGVAHSHGCIPEGVDPNLHRHDSLYVPAERKMIIREVYYESRPDDVTVWRYGLSSGGPIDDPNYGLGRGMTTLGDPGRGEIIWYDVTDLTGIDDMAELAQGPR